MDGHHHTDERQFGLGRFLAIAFVVAMIVFWVGSVVPGSPWGRSENPDRLVDRGFVAQAESRCAQSRALIDALPPGQDAETPQERAEQVALGTDEVEVLVADLAELARSLPAGDGSGTADADLIERWLEDWELYVADRWTHVERLRAADDSTPAKDLRFLLSARVQGGTYTERMDGFARVNDMDSCQIPGDV